VATLDGPHLQEDPRLALRPYSSFCETLRKVVGRVSGNSPLNNRSLALNAPLSADNIRVWHPRRPCLQGPAFSTERDSVRAPGLESTRLEIDLQELR
jgi:hypothetical protein